MEITEVARHFRLRQLEEINEIANAELAGDQQVENPNPCRIGEPAEEEIKICDRIGGRCCHIGGS